MKQHIELLLRRRYQLGLLDIEDINLPIKERYKRIQWISNPNWKNCWYADPFLLEATEKHIIVLAEEFLYKQNKGRLSKLVIDKKSSKIIQSTPILETDTHLSFPYIYVSTTGQKFVIPENHQSGSCYIYEYNSNSESLTNKRKLINTPLIDPQLFFLDNHFYIWGIVDNPSTVHIYKANTLFGPYTEQQVISNSKKEERGAGQFITFKGHYFRPVMSCEGGYGTEVIIKEILISDGRFSEKEIFRIIPDRSKINSHSFHTFNVLNNTCIVDGEDFNGPLFARIYIPVLYALQGKRR